MRLNVRAFAFACAVVWGLGLFLATWWMIIAGTAPKSATLLSRIYIGYSATPAGSVVGLVWAFVDGLIGGAILAWLYNAIVERAAMKDEVYRKRFAEQLRRAHESLYGASQGHDEKGGDGS